MALLGAELTPVSRGRTRVHICVSAAALQEKRRAERAEQQRVRAEKEKERQAKREVRAPPGNLQLRPTWFFSQNHKIQEFPGLRNFLGFLFFIHALNILGEFIGFVQKRLNGQLGKSFCHI